MAQTNPKNPDRERQTMTETEHDLGTFEGHPVLSHAIELPSLAGGLREAAEVAGSSPIRMGERRVIIIEVEGNKTRFDPVKNTNGFQRVDIPKVETLTFTELDVVQQALQAHREKAEALRLEKQKAAEAEAGVQRVPGTEPWADGDEDGDDLPTDGFGDDDLPGDEATTADPDAIEGDELDPPDDPDDAAWEAGEDAGTAEPEPDAG